jgi:hypothetical protein
MALLTLLVYARDQHLTDWDSIGSPLYYAYLNDGIGSALGLAKGSSGAASPSGQMLSEIAYSALDSGTMPFGNTGIQSLFADADTLGEIVSGSGFSGTMEGKNVLTGLTEILVQQAGDLAASDNTNATAAQGAFSYNDNFLTINLDPANWQASFKTTAAASTSNIIGLGDLAKAVLSNISHRLDASDPTYAWVQGIETGNATFTNRLNQITLVSASLGGGDISGASAAPTADQGPGGALLVGQDGQGAIIGTANGDDLIVGGATVTTGDGNDIIITSKGSETINLGAGNNQILAGGQGVNDTFNYASTSDTDLVIGNEQGGDSFTFDNAAKAAFTAVWGATGDDTYDINASTSADTDVLLLNMSGVTASNIRILI